MILTHPLKLEHMLSLEETNKANKQTLILPLKLERLGTYKHKADFIKRL
jgi:hypothetical protein